MKVVTVDYVLERPSDYHTLGELIESLDRLKVSEVRVNLNSTEFRLWPEVAVVYDEAKADEAAVLARIEQDGFDEDSMTVCPV